jgi:hypothetical protein
MVLLFFLADARSHELRSNPEIDYKSRINKSGFTFKTGV